MKNILFTVITLLFAISCFGQTFPENGVKIYRLFPTDNVWTFIKLNTRNGLMKQVQFSMEDQSFESSLNTIKLVEAFEEADNRFTLYKTQNIWTFILLDQIDGRTWQVQWSTDYEQRGIIPIERY